MALRRLELLREEKGYCHSDNLKTTDNIITSQCRNLSNQKKSCHDGVQGYWSKNLTSLDRCLVHQMDEMIKSKGVLPAWLAKGKTVL